MGKIAKFRQLRRMAAALPPDLQPLPPVRLIATYGAAMRLAMKRKDGKPLERPDRKGYGYSATLEGKFAVSHYRRLKKMSQGPGAAQRIAAYAAHHLAKLAPDAPR